MLRTRHNRRHDTATPQRRRPSRALACARGRSRCRRSRPFCPLAARRSPPQARARAPLRRRRNGSSNPRRLRASGKRSPPGARPSRAPRCRRRSPRTSPSVRRPDATGARALRARPPGSISPSPRSPWRTRPPASTRPTTPPESAPAALLLTSELRRVLATLPAKLASRDGCKRPVCVGWASLAPASTRGRAGSSQVAEAVSISERSRWIGRLLRESGSKQVGAALFSGVCVRATRTPPPAMRRT